MPQVAAVVAAAAAVAGQRVRSPAGRPRFPSEVRMGRCLAEALRTDPADRITARRGLRLRRKATCAATATAALVVVPRRERGRAREDPPHLPVAGTEGRAAAVEAALGCPSSSSSNRVLLSVPRRVVRWRSAVGGSVGTGRVAATKSIELA